MPEYKTSEIQNLKVVDEAAGVVEAFTNTMGRPDADGDIILPSAFDNSIADSMPTVLLGHDPSKVVGKVLEAHSINFGDEAKLYNKIQFNLDTQLGRETFSNVAGGFIKEWSVGFNIPPGGVEYEEQEGNTYRVIKDLDWVEVSSVIRGASPETSTISAKAEPLTADTEPIPVAATDEQPIAAEAWTPVTDEQRAQVRAAVEFRSRLLGLRIEQNETNR
mgnify:CR=1 FL=1